MKLKHIHGWIALVLCLQLVIWASGTVSAKEVTVERFHVPLVEIGSVPPYHEESAHPEVSEAIYKAMIGLENKLDLSKYQITTNEVVECYSALINDRYFIDLFYASSSFGCSYNTQTLIVNYIEFEYTMTNQEILQRQAFIDKELNAILENVDSKWSDLEKILFLHDHLCMGFRYDLSLTIGDVYTFLQGKTGVCEAYYGTYRMLLEKLGIDSHSATSAGMNHVWNMIELDGKWYHVDATWGDPTPDLLGRARHYHFLLSDTGINTQAPHESYHYGWVAGSRVPAEGANSTKYEGWFWNKVNSPFVPLGDKWYYIDTEYGICSVDFDEDDLDMEKEHAITELWWAVDQPGAYWPGMYTGLSRHGNELIYNTYNQVIAFDPQNNTTRVVYTLEIDEKLILGSAMQDGQLRIQLDTTPNISNQEIYTVEDYHNWVPADCENPKTCAACGITEGDPIGHEWIAADCDTPKTCNTCGETEGTALGHKWDEGRVIQAPTYDATGKKLYTCLHDANHTYEEVIQALEKPANLPVSLKLTGDTALTVKSEKAVYTLSAESMKNLTEVLLVLDYDEEYLTEPTTEACDGWFVLCSGCENGKLTVILCSESGAEGNADLLHIAWRLTGKIGSVSISISEVHLNAGEVEVEVMTEQAQISTIVKAVLCDLNGDGTVSLLDMTRAQHYFGEDYPDADLNGDQTVSVQDLILILMNFTV